MRELATGSERHFTYPPDGAAICFFPVVHKISWAPDSRHLAFSRDDSGGDIFILDTTSASTLADVTSLNPGPDYGYASPTWLPDGRIAVHKFGTDDAQLVAVDPSTKAETELAPSLHQVAGAEADPSGHHLLVITFREGDEDNPFPTYRVSDGGQPVLVPGSYNAVDW